MGCPRRAVPSRVVCLSPLVGQLLLEGKDRVFLLLYPYQKFRAQLIFLKKNIKKREEGMEERREEVKKGERNVNKRGDS